MAKESGARPGRSQKPGPLYRTPTWGERPKQGGYRLLFHMLLVCRKPEWKCRWMMFYFREREIFIGVLPKGLQ